MSESMWLVLDIVTEFNRAIDDINHIAENGVDRLNTATE